MEGGNSQFRSSKDAQKQFVKFRIPFYNERDVDICCELPFDVRRCADSTLVKSWVIYWSFGREIYWERRKFPKCEKNPLVINLGQANGSGSCTSTFSSAALAEALRLANCGHRFPRRLSCHSLPVQQLSS